MLYVYILISVIGFFIGTLSFIYSFRKDSERVPYEWILRGIISFFGGMYYLHMAIEIIHSQTYLYAVC